MIVKMVCICDKAFIKKDKVYKVRIETGYDEVFSVQTYCLKFIQKL